MARHRVSETWPQKQIPPMAQTRSPRIHPMHGGATSTHTGLGTFSKGSILDERRKARLLPPHGLLYQAHPRSSTLISRHPRLSMTCASREGSAKYRADRGKRGQRENMLPSALTAIQESTPSHLGRLQARPSISSRLNSRSSALCHQRPCLPPYRLSCTFMYTHKRCGVKKHEATRGKKKDLYFPRKN